MSIETPNSIAHKADVRSDEGATMVEYMLLLTLLALVCIAGMQFLGSHTSSAFSRVGSNFTTT